MGAADADHTGLVVVDKPAGWTSHDVVAKLRGVYSQRRIGHAGTLDPDATGVLLVGLGRVTRLLRFLSSTTKVYRGAIVFGVATDTLDASGAVLERDPLPITRDELVAATHRFVGDVFQVPPMVSAVRVGGRRLHELHREGREVEREPRPVRIDRIGVEDLVEGPYPEATVTVECGPGTYIRALAADLGAALGGAAHLKWLRRLRVGPFTERDAHSVSEIEVEPGSVVLTPASAMRALEVVRVDPQAAAAVRHGATFPATAVLTQHAGDGPFAVVDAEGELLAVYERHRGGVKPAVVLAVPERSS